MLTNRSDIRQYFYRNETLMYYVDVFNFHLLGIDEWVRRFRFINYNDCFDGLHGNIFVPPRELSASFPFAALEEVNNYLLTRPKTGEYVVERGPGGPYSSTTKNVQLRFANGSTWRSLSRR